MQTVKRFFQRFWVAATILYVACAVLWLAPASLNPAHRLLVGRNDATLTLTLWRWEASIGKNPWTTTTDKVVAAPEGAPLVRAVNFVSPVEPAFNWTLRHVFGWVLTFNLYLFLGLVGSALAFAFLVRRIGGSSRVALIGGYLFAFNPWMIMHGRLGDDSFTQVWILAFLFAACLRVSEKRDVVSALLVGLCIAGSFLIFPYIGLLAVFIATIYLVYEVVRVKGLAERLWTISLATVAGLVCILCLVPGLILWWENPTAVSALSRSSADRETYAMRLWSYFLWSPTHPVLGSVTNWIKAPESPESVATIGLAGLVLAALGAYWVLRSKTSSPLHRRVALLAVVLVVGGFWASLQRVNHVGPLGIPGMSFFFEHVTTYYRVYARFAIVVLFGLLLLACFALERLRRRPWVFYAATALMVFETLPGFAPAFNTDVGPPYTQWLARQPRGIVAVYPMMTDIPGTTKIAIEAFLDQFYTHDPLFSTYSADTPGTREDAIRIMARYLTSPQTPSILAAEGVRYVVIHEDAYRENGQKLPAHVRGFHDVARFGNLRIMRLSGVKPANIDALLAQNAVSIAQVQGVAAPAVTVNGQAQGVLETGDLLQVTPQDEQLRRVLVSVTFSNVTAPETFRLVDGSGTQISAVDVPAGTNRVTLTPIEVPWSKPLAYRIVIDRPSEFSDLSGQPLAGDISLNQLG